MIDLIAFDLIYRASSVCFGFPDERRAFMFTQKGGDRVSCVKLVSGVVERLNGEAVSSNILF